MPSKIRPFLKWAGGKYEITDKIVELLPPANTFIEPFVGSAVVFLNTNYRINILNDINEDLISLYKNIQQYKTRYINDAKTFFVKKNNVEEKYYRMRERFNESTDPYERSLIFLYLNRFGYNGLCRYNKSGKFNVPFGRYKAPYFPEKELNYFIEKSKGTNFVCKDFRDVISGARRGQVVYCDPPYVPLSGTANFSSYSSGGFGKDDQIDLAVYAKKAAERGVAVLISNHDTPFTRKIYKGAKLRSFDVRRNISCKTSNRGKVKELLAFYERKK